MTITDHRPSGKPRTFAPGFVFFTSLLKAILRKFETELCPLFSLLIESRPVPPVRKHGQPPLARTGQSVIVYIPVVSTNARFPLTYRVSVEKTTHTYQFYAGMNADGSLVLVASPGSGWMYRLDGDGLRRDRLPQDADLFEDEQFEVVFYVNENAFPRRHFTECMACVGR
jgi:hypothetical protein